jgi:aminomethyltransferase
MGQLHVEGPATAEFLQSVLSNDIDRLADGEAQYTLLTTESGGIVDDLIVYRMSHGHYLLVVNAGQPRSGVRLAQERERRGTEVRDASDDYALVAVQGPRRSTARARRGTAFTHAMGEVGGVEVMVCRTGYTGEKGVELLCPPRTASRSGTRARARGRPVRARRARHAAPRGLLPAPRQRHHAGHRRDLRGLGWACALDTDFTGATRSAASRTHGPERRLVAFVDGGEGDPAPGHGDRGGGEVTSGTHSPSLDVGIGWATSPVAQAAEGQELEIDVRRQATPWPVS